MHGADTPRLLFRLALVTETYPPEINGVAMTLARLVEALRRRGHEVVVHRPRQRHEARQDAPEGERILPGMPLPFYPTLRLGLPAAGALRASWRKQRPDLVHVATEGFLGLSALRAALDLRIPVTSAYHTHFDDFVVHYGAPWLAPPIREAMRVFHNRTRVTLVPSESVERRLRETGVHNTRILGRGVDTTHFQASRRSTEERARWGVSGEQLALVTTGRLAPEKNLDLAIRAFRAIQAGDPDARLVLVGDGPVKEQLEQLEGVVAVGAVPHAEVGHYLASADLFLFPSLTETYGNVLCEAMACGLATVSFDYAAAAQWVRHGENGLKVPFGDEDAFVEHACRAAANPLLRRALGTAAADTMARSGWRGVVERFESIVRTVANGVDS